MATGGANDKLDIEIVGLVKDAKYSEVKDAIPPLFFRPYRQDERVGSITFYVRTAGAPEQIIQTIQRVVATRRSEPAGREPAHAWSSRSATTSSSIG